MTREQCVQKCPSSMVRSVLSKTDLPELAVQCWLLLWWKPQTNEGVRVRSCADESMGLYTEQDILVQLRLLENEGLVYTTVDATTFAVMEFFT